MKMGEKHTAEALEKMSAGQSKRAVEGTNVATGEVIFLTSTRAAKDHGWASSNIVACCKGRKKSCYGYTWRYQCDSTT